MTSAPLASYCDDGYDADPAVASVGWAATGVSRVSARRYQWSASSNRP